jgi:hypothetical protein
VKQSAVIALTMLVKPFALVLLLSVAYPFKLLVQRKMKEGKLKQLLLRRINS